MQTSAKFWSVVSIGMALCAVPLRAEVLYIADGTNNVLHAYRVAENGSLAEEHGSPFPTGLNPAAIAVDVPGRLVFTLNTNVNDYPPILLATISVFRGNATGAALTKLAQVSVDTSSAALAVDPFGRFLYVTSYDGSQDNQAPIGQGPVGHLSVYRIGINGSLTLAPGSPYLTGRQPATVITDPFGRFVYTGNLPFSGQDDLQTISGFSVNGNGSLTQLSGSQFQYSDGPHAIAIDPLGRFLYSAGVWGLGLVTYKEQGTGGLTYLPTSYFPIFGGEEGPLFYENTVAVGPLGRFVYQLYASGTEVPNGFSIYRVGANGLTSVSYQPADYSNVLVVDPLERFIFAGPTEYQIGANGSLTALPPISFGFETGAMAFSPW
jgi:6-phosphogluconolactonase (cycloisomerase 2 family)